MIKKEKMNQLMTMLEDKCNEHIIKYFAKKHKKSMRMKFNTPTLIKRPSAMLPLKRNKRIEKHCNNKLTLRLRSCGREMPKKNSRPNIGVLLSSSTTF